MEWIIFFYFLYFLCRCLGQEDYEGRVFSPPETEEHPRYPYIAYGFSIEELNGTRTDIKNVEVTVQTDLLMDTSRIFQAADQVCDMAAVQPTGVTIYTIPQRNDDLKTVYCNLYVSYQFVAKALDNEESRARFGSFGLQASLAQLNQFFRYQPRDRTKIRTSVSKGGACKTIIAALSDHSQSTENQADSSSQQSNRQTSTTEVCTNEERTQLTIAQRMVKHVAYAFREANMFRSQLELGVLLMRGIYPYRQSLLLCTLLPPHSFLMFLVDNRTFGDQNPTLIQQSMRIHS